MNRMEWWVCREDGTGRKEKCFACTDRYEAEQDAAFLNRIGEGRFCVVRER